MKNWNIIWKIHKARELAIMDYAVNSLEKIQRILQSEKNENTVKEIEGEIKSMITWMSIIKKGDE